MEQQPEKRGRARKYNTEEERKAAKNAYIRQYRQRMREENPEEFRERSRVYGRTAAQKYRDMRTLVEEAEVAGGARLLEEEVVVARAYVEHQRAVRTAAFMRRYNNDPEFKERHLAKVADYGRRMTLERNQLKSQQ